MSTDRLDPPAADDLPSLTKPSGAGVPAAVAPVKPLPRISSRQLLRDRRVIEIDHEGRIYQLRVTQQNKLILTA